MKKTYFNNLNEGNSDFSFQCYFHKLADTDPNPLHYAEIIMHLSFDCVHLDTQRTFKRQSSHYWHDCKTSSEATQTLWVSSSFPPTFAFVICTLFKSVII